MIVSKALSGWLQNPKNNEGLIRVLLRFERLGCWNPRCSVTVLTSRISTRIFPLKVRTVTRFEWAKSKNVSPESFFWGLGASSSEASSSSLSSSCSSWNSSSSSEDSTIFCFFLSGLDAIVLYYFSLLLLEDPFEILCLLDSLQVVVALRQTLYFTRSVFVC